MPFLAGFLGGLFGKLAEFFAQFMTRKIAIVAAMVVIVGGLTVGLYQSVTGLISALSYAIPSEILIASSWVVPSNADACLTAMLTARVARWTYDWQIRIIQYKLI